MPANCRLNITKKITVGYTISKFPIEVNVEGHTEPKIKGKIHFEMLKTHLQCHSNLFTHHTHFYKKLGLGTKSSLK